MLKEALFFAHLQQLALLNRVLTTVVVTMHQDYDANPQSQHQVCALQLLLIWAFFVWWIGGVNALLSPRRQWIPINNIWATTLYNQTARAFYAKH